MICIPHIGSDAQGADPDFVFKLWMAHGVTTVREVAGRGIDITLDLKQKSQKNEIIAPCIILYTTFGQTSKSFNPLNDIPISTPDQAREWMASQRKKRSRWH